MSKHLECHYAVTIVYFTPKFFTDTQRSTEITLHNSADFTAITYIA